MLNMNEYELQKIRRDEIRRESERLNEIQAAFQSENTDDHPFYASLLAEVGKVLVDIGSKLQEQYGCLMEDVQYSAEPDRDPSSVNC